MSLPADLLEQARHLATKEPRRPKQASLRRAVSSAYYAIFHLLVDEASRRFVVDSVPRQLIARAFVHSEMKKASKSFAGGALPQKFAGITRGKPLPDPLRTVARAFVELQEARHEADYNLSRSFRKAEAESLIDQVEQAFQDWDDVRKTDFGQLYLLSLLFWDRWEKFK